MRPFISPRLLIYLRGCANIRTNVTTIASRCHRRRAPRARNGEFSFTNRAYRPVADGAPGNARRRASPPRKWRNSSGNPFFFF